MMFFESVIHDSYEPEIFFREEHGDDQSLSTIGGYPSTSYIESIFDECHAKYEKFSDSSLNGGAHHYDWVDSDSRVHDPHSRRFWIIGEIK